MHEADQPDVIGNLPDSNVVTGEDGAEIDLASAKAQPPALCDGDGLIMQRVLQRWEPAIGTR